MDRRKLDPTDATVIKSEAPLSAILRSFSSASRKGMAPDDVTVGLFSTGTRRWTATVASDRQDRAQLSNSRYAPEQCYLRCRR
jgi:hypothetical protein